MMRPTPPKKRDRNADGWELIGFYYQRNGVVDLRDADIASSLRWKTSKAAPDGERVRTTRAHVNNKSRREKQEGFKPGDPRRVFSGWHFAYRDIKGSPSVLIDDNGELYDEQGSLFALLGDRTRFTQHSSERIRAQGWARAAAEQAVKAGRLTVAMAWLDYEHDLATFGQPQDVTVEHLRQLLTASP